MLIHIKPTEKFNAQCSSEEYAANLPLLLDQSIGNHIRLILEFYDQLINNVEKEVLNYDKRKHDHRPEVNIHAALEKLKILEQKTNKIENDRDIWLEASYATDNERPVKVKTSINREFAYNIEHAIHHMALIKIAVITMYPKITLPDHFGVAYSTIRHQNH